MYALDAEKRIAFTACIEVVLMRSGNIQYHAVLAKLEAYYKCEGLQLLENIENLRDVLREVYGTGYDSILNNIMAETDQLDDIDEFKVRFSKIMKN
ncbi:MAG TPA: hypothetical protein VJ571_04095 [Candidatus Nitrosotalea sp.]|nr:hypothetical protein [Candidatus Nitrosotalea sp.]